MTAQSDGTPLSDAEFNFSLAPQVFGPFKIGDVSYILKEATEAAHIAYRDATMRSMRVAEDSKGEKIASVAGGSEADTILIAYCLFRRSPDPGNPSFPPDATVPVEFVKSLPRRITSKLYFKVRELSGMDEDQETKDFLTKRIEGDKKKLDALSKKELPADGGPSTTSITSV